MNHELSLIDCINYAKKATKRASEVKDWRLTRKHDRQMKKLAIELSKGKGYIIATSSDLHERYPNLYPQRLVSTESHPFVWAIDFSLFGYGDKLNFVPIR